MREAYLVKREANEMGQKIQIEKLDHESRMLRNLIKRL